MSTDLSSWKSLAQAYTPGWNSEGYDAYIKTLPKGVFPVDESDWRQSAFQGSLKDKYTEYKNGGGGLSFEDYTAGTSTNPLMATGANDGRIRNNVIGEAHSTINEGSVAQGGGITDKQTIVDQANAGLIEIPGYTSEALGNVPEMSVDTDKGGVPTIEDNPLDTGTDQLDSYNELTGAMTNGNGDDITPTDDDKNQAKGIFDKASDLFGDIASASDLRRMTLYTVGGLMTGGSIQGSFKWAGMQVMQEQQANNKAAATLSAATAKSNAALFNEEPKQVKIRGINTPVQARYIDGAWYSAETNKKLKGAVNWNEGTHGIKANKADYNNIIKSLSTNIKNEDGTEVQLGDTSYAVVSSWMQQVDHWNTKGYGVDITDEDTVGAFKVAVEKSLAANKNFEEGRDMKTPAHFFEATLIQGMTPGGDKLFQDTDGNFMSSDGTSDMVNNVNTIIESELVKARKAGGTVTLSSVMGDLHGAWGKLGAKGQKPYNEGAGPGRSGFSKFVEAYRNK